MSDTITIKSLPMIQPLADGALQIVVNSSETETAARTYLAKVDQGIKNLDADEEALKRPHLDFLDAVRKATKPWKDLLTSRRKALNDKIVAYVEKVDAAIAKANAKALEKFEDKVAIKEAEAIADGKPIPLVLPPALRAGMANTVEIAGTKQTTASRRKWRLPAVCGSLDPEVLTYDINLKRKLGIPSEFFILDTAKVGKVIRAGGSVSGIESYQDKTISSKAL